MPLFPRFHRQLRQFTNRNQKSKAVGRQQFKDALVETLEDRTLLSGAAVPDLGFAIQFEGDSNSRGHGLESVADQFGNVYTTGVFEGTVDFDPGAGTSYLTSAGQEDIFVSKVDSNGNFLWARSFGGFGDDRSYALDVDTNGNVYLTGRYEGTIDFDPGAGVTELTSEGYRDIFLSKFDSNGNFEWAKSMGGAGNDYGHALKVDGAGNVFTAGHFVESFDFDPGTGTSTISSAGGRDIYFSRFDTSGNLDWVRTIAGNDTQQAFGIEIDAAGNSYLTGNFKGSTDFDPGTGTSYLSSTGENDIFVAKYNASGNYLWVRSYSGIE